MEEEIGVEIDSQVLDELIYQIKMEGNKDKSCYLIGQTKGKRIIVETFFISGNQKIRNTPLQEIVQLTSKTLYEGKEVIGLATYEPGSESDLDYNSLGFRPKIHLKIDKEGKAQFFTCS